MLVLALWLQMGVGRMGEQPEGPSGTSACFMPHTKNTHSLPCGQRRWPCDQHVGGRGHQGSKDGVAEAARGRGGGAGTQVPGHSLAGVRGSGLEELLVHLGVEGPTGAQCVAHKLLGHVPGEGATCFQTLGP